MSEWKDFLNYTLTWDNDEVLDWDAGFRAIEALEEDEDGYVNCHEQTRDDYIRMLTMLKQIIEVGVHPELSIMEVGSVKIAIAGGTENSLSEIYYFLCDLDEKGIPHVVGFHKPQPDYKKILLSVPDILPTLMGMDDRLDEIIAERLKNV